MQATELDTDLSFADDELELLVEGTFDGMGELFGPHWKLEPGKAGKLIKRVRRAAKAKGSKAKKWLESFEQKAPGLSLALYLFVVILLPRVLLTFDNRRRAKLGAGPAPTPKPVAPASAPAPAPMRPVHGFSAPAPPAPAQSAAPVTVGREAGGVVVGDIRPSRPELAGDGPHDDGRAAGRVDASLDDVFREG